MKNIKLKKRINKNNCPTFVSEFKDLNISRYTLISLYNLGYKKMTSIQKISIPPSLKGFDVLGSARTGSGKTLCFIIPVIEILWIQKWTKMDKIGGCIMCPTRELAIQTFDFTRNIGKKHNIKTKVLIGGIRLNQKIFFSMLISTPGCLFNYLVNDNNLNLDNLKILAIDEADKILDISFRKTIDLMSNFLPKKKQILLFSATLNSKIKNITRLNLKAPVYCSLDRKISRKEASDKSLYYISPVRHFVVFLYTYQKIDYLFSFLKSHKTQKVIIFLSTKKQVTFLSNIVKEFFPDILIFYIHGSMNQEKRMNNFLNFNQYTKGFLFSTDLTSRGLDFKSIDWIVQLECPQTTESYIHRVGRTGRFLDSGKTILFLDYNESKFVNTLDKNLIRIHSITFNKKYVISIQKKLETILKKNICLLSLAQSAFVSYARFVYFQKNKEYSNFSKFNWKKIASSFGLICSFFTEAI